MINLVAGAHFGRIHDALAPWLTRRLTVPARWRRQGLPGAPVGADVPVGQEITPGPESNPTPNEDSPQERVLGAVAAKAS